MGSESGLAIVWSRLVKYGCRFPVGGRPPMGEQSIVVSLSKRVGRSVRASDGSDGAGVMVDGDL